MWLAEVLHGAGVDGRVVGLVWEPDIVAEAFAAGEGRGFLARLTRGSTDPFARPVEADATVLSLREGEMTNTRGFYAGYTLDRGRGCALAIGNPTVLVTSLRQQNAGR